MRIGLSPSPSPSPLSPEPSTSRARPRPERRRVSGGRTRTPPPPNRFALRDSDTSETSEDDSESCSDDGGNDGDDNNRTPRRKSSNRGRRHEDAEDNWEFDTTPISPPANPNRTPRTKEERWEQEEFYAAVRLRQRRDPVQEYEDRTRKEAWKLAHIKNREQWLPVTALLDTTPEHTAKRLAELNAQQLEEVRLVLEEVTLIRKREQNQRRAEHDRQDRELRESIEKSIAAYEEEVRLIKVEQDRIAAATKAKKEAEVRQLQAEAEAKARAIAVKAKEEAEKAIVEKKRLEEEEEQKKRAEEQAKREEEEAKLDAASAAYRPMSAAQELKGSRNFLTVIKSEIMPQVKSTKLRPDVQPNQDWKKELTRLRRQIIPKVGQVTNTRAQVERISTQLHQILAPTPRHPQQLYVALCYVLSKAILKQAEEEVTAKPSTAFPLARIVMALVEQGHDILGKVFVAKLISMSSHWIVGTAIGRELNQSDEDYRKSLGYRLASSGETTPQYIERMGGLVTLYTAILQTPTQSTTSREAAQKIPAYLRFPRFWTWLARLVGNRDLMSDSAAPHILACALEVAGDRAIETWGRQMNKLRAVLGRKAFEADGSVDLLGGEEGKAGRVRLGLLLEAWQKNGAIRPAGREYEG